MASRRGGSRKQGNVVTLSVWHGDRDSFSRSVDACATRWAGQHEWFSGARAVKLVSVDYAVDTLASGECVSDFHYEVS